MSNDAEGSLEERLTRIERELERQKTGLRLLGVEACSRCETFYQRSDARSLFNCGELVCFKCIQQWWLERCPKFNPKDRLRAEGELCRWLLNHHQGELIRRLVDLPSAEQLRIKLVVACESCNGEGKTHSGRKCSQCDGRGSLWVVVRGPGFALTAKNK
jgi:hypothetical protein